MGSALDIVSCKGLVHSPYCPVLSLGYAYFIEQAEGGQDGQ